MPEIFEGVKIIGKYHQTQEEFHFVFTEKLGTMYNARLEFSLKYPDCFKRQDCAEKCNSC
jgi:hypothetical protein